MHTTVQYGTVSKETSQPLKGGGTDTEPLLSIVLSLVRFPFTLSSKFRYSGRTEFQTVKESSSSSSGGFLGSSSRRLLMRQTLPPSLEKKQRSAGKLLASPEHSSIGGHQPFLTQHSGHQTKFRHIAFIDTVPYLIKFSPL
jgi:hypothetical protein